MPESFGSLHTCVSVSVCVDVRMQRLLIEFYPHPCRRQPTAVAGSTSELVACVHVREKLLRKIRLALTKRPPRDRPTRRPTRQTKSRTRRTRTRVHAKRPGERREMVAAAVRCGCKVRALTSEPLLLFNVFCVWLFCVCMFFIKCISSSKYVELKLGLGQEEGN